MYTKPFETESVRPIFSGILHYNLHEVLTTVRKLTNARYVMDRLLKGREPGAWAEVLTAYHINSAGFKVEFS
ncbi:MAG TPA: hypothetical protein ACFYEM_10085, partial [Candidatus Hypogeohydataceae bacterium YC40]